MKRYANLPLTTPKVHLGLIPKGYSGTIETVKRMKSLIRKGARDFYVRQKAIDVLIEKGVRPKAYLREIQALFQWVQQNVRYTKDPHKVEVLHSARRMLELRAGDCDDISILLGSMLEAIGHPVRLVLTGPNPTRRDLFSHVLLEVNFRGRWIPLDATMPYPMGWTPPAAQRKVFPIEKEVKMIGLSEEVLEGYPENGLADEDIGMANEDLLGEEAETYSYTQTVDGLGDVGNELYGTTPVAVPWLGRFSSRLLRVGVRRRDPQVRAVYNLLRRRGLLTRRGFARRFLRAAFRRGMPAQSRYSRRFVRQLRSWGLLPRQGFIRRPSARWRGYPSWYRRPPLWYLRPPPWYGRGGISPLIRRRIPAVRTPSARRIRRSGIMRFLRPAQALIRPQTAIRSATRLPTQVIRASTVAPTAPLRVVRSLFR